MAYPEDIEKLAKRKKELKSEELAKKVHLIEVRPGRIQTWYKDGRVVTEYPRDKRKKTTVDYRGIK
jgi:hypothetical protein